MKKNSDKTRWNTMQTWIIMES